MTTKANAIDMSSEAITARLEVVRGLYKLCMSLYSAGAAAGLHRRGAPIVEIADAPSGRVASEG